MSSEHLSKNHGMYTAEEENPLTYNCSYDVFCKNFSFRGTGIVCTIGPASANVDTISEMIAAGMTISRHNFSHGSHADHAKMMEMVRTARSKAPQGGSIAIALDTKGPEIRTGLNKDGATITLIKDETVTLTTDDKYKESSTKDKIYVDYKSLAKSIKVGQIILVADGNVVLHATAIKGDEVVCSITSGASFGGRKNICLPMVSIDLPALSEKDIDDIKFGIDQKVDIIFASFIRSGQHVKEIREILNPSPEGKHIKIVSKIENHEGIRNILDIIRMSDGIMVARGDLGMDLELERVVPAQKMIAAMCNREGKPVIVATQMLESMINSFRPTRAEVSDVTNAVFDGADCVMLSGESANGKYPVQSVKFMNSICSCAERMYRPKKIHDELGVLKKEMGDKESIAFGAVNMSYTIQAEAIFVISHTGKEAHLISMFRPRCPIFMVTGCQKVARASCLYRNVFPIIHDTGKCSDKKTEHDVDVCLKYALKYAIEKGLCKVGGKAVFASGGVVCPKRSDSIRIITIANDGELVRSE